jgi:SSS family solute:Na+ symporter
VVFLVSLAAAVIVSLVSPTQAAVNTLKVDGVSFHTPPVFNAAAVGVVVILTALYATWW